MWCVNYFVHVYVDSNMSQSLKESFTDIWILTSSMIEKDDIKDVSLDRAYCKAINIYKVPSYLYLRNGVERSCLNTVHIHG